MSNTLLRRIGTAVTASALALSLGGVSGMPTAYAAEHLEASRQDSLQCPVSTDAEVYREAYQVRGRTKYRAVVRTATEIGPNEYWFVGCRINVVTRLKMGGEVIRTVEHEALAGSKWDPFGNHKWYTWLDRIPIEDLDDADALDIRHEQR